MKLPEVSLVASDPKGFQVNRELWKASGGVNDWRSLLTWPVLGWWWATWIPAGVLGRIAAAARSGAETPMALRSADLVELLWTADLVASAVLAILLVRSVVARQDRLAAAVPHRRRGHLPGSRSGDPTRRHWCSPSSTTSRRSCVAT